MPCHVRLDIDRLRDPDVVQGYVNKLAEKPEELDAYNDTQTPCCDLKTCILESASESILRLL